MTPASAHKMGRDAPVIRLTLVRILLLPTLALCLIDGAVLSAQEKSSGAASPPTKDIPARFVDIAKQAGVKFDYKSSHTTKKYLIETMAPGVALFDYDNDGRLDIFVVNGTPLDDPTPKGTIPQKAGPKY